MGNDIDVFTKLEMIDDSPQFAMLFEDESESAQKIAQHKIWLQSIRHERPSVSKPFRVGISEPKNIIVKVRSLDDLSKIIIGPAVIKTNCMTLRHKCFGDLIDKS